MIAVRTKALKATIDSLGMTEWLTTHIPNAKMRFLFEDNGNLSSECEFLFETRGDAMRFKLVWG